MARMTHRPSLVATMLAVPLLMLSPACRGGNSSPAPTQAANVTEQTSSAGAQRPDWFPASFPLSAGTTVDAESPAQGGGGHATFRAPVPFEQAVKILDLNLDSHGYQVNDRSVSEQSASYKISSSQFTGSVDVTVDSGSALLAVTLTPR